MEILNLKMKMTMMVMIFLICLKRQQFKATTEALCIDNSLLRRTFEVKQDVFVKHNAPIMANSNEGQDHKDKYFDTSRRILSQEMTMCNMEAQVSYL